MTEYGSDLFEPDILAQHLACGGVSEDVGSSNWRSNTGTLQGAPGDMADRVSGVSACERFERCNRA